MNDDATTYCYIGRMPVCGCIGVVTVDKPEYAKDTAKSLAEMVRDGLHVERITIEAFRNESGRFGCAKKLKMKDCAKGIKPEPDLFTKEPA